MSERAARVRGQYRPERQQAGGVPVDDRFQKINNEQRSDPRLGQYGVGRIAQAQATDRDIEFIPATRRNPQRAESDFGIGDDARHQELIAELDFKDIFGDARLVASP